MRKSGLFTLAVLACAGGFGPAALSSRAASKTAESHAAEGAAAEAAQTRTVYVMRHLPPGEGGDPSLSPTGRVEACMLSERLKAAGIKAIFVTATHRSMETAAPLAAALGLTPIVYDPRQPDAVVAQARSGAGAALIVAHSNTVGDLVVRLGGAAPAADETSGFGTIWQIDPGASVHKTGPDYLAPNGQSHCS